MGSWMYMLPPVSWRFHQRGFNQQNLWWHQGIWAEYERISQLNGASCDGFWNQPLIKMASSIRNGQTRKQAVIWFWAQHLQVFMLWCLHHLAISWLPIHRKGHEVWPPVWQHLWINDHETMRWICDMKQVPLIHGMWRIHVHSQKITSFSENWIYLGTWNNPHQRVPYFTSFSENWVHYNPHCSSIYHKPCFFQPQISVHQLSKLSLDGPILELIIDDHGIPYRMGPLNVMFVGS